MSYKFNFIISSPILIKGTEILKISMIFLLSANQFTWNTWPHFNYFQILSFQFYYLFIDTNIFLIQMQLQDYQLIQKVQLKHKPQVRHVIAQKAELMTVKFGYEDQLVAAGYSDGHVRIYNINTNKLINDLNPSQNLKDNGPINTLKWRPSNQTTQTISSVLLVANSNGHLYQYVAKTGKEIYHSNQQNNFILALDFSSDGRLFSTGGKDNIVRVYDQQTKKITTQLKSLQWQKVGHSNRLFCVKFNPEDKNILVSGGWDQNINIWDLRTNAAAKTLYGPKISGEAIDIKDNQILTAANRSDDQLQIWSISEGKVQYTFEWDESNNKSGSQLFSCQFCPYMKNAVIASGGNQMKMFSLEDKKQIFELRCNKQQNFYTCDSSTAHSRYLAGGKHGKLFYISTNE